MVKELHTTTIRFNTFNTRRNLPPASGQKRGEANFVSAFCRCYGEQYSDGGVCVRDFVLTGYGVPDLLWFHSPPPRKKLPHLLAFEMKLDNWKRALTQAHRYRYFADLSVVVLPDCTAGRAVARLDLFEHLGVGLWSFDPKAVAVTKHYTPDATQPKNPAAREIAVSRILRKLDLRKTGK